MTPRELSLYAEAYRERLSDETKMTRANIYALASLVRVMMNRKTVPRFEEVFPQDIRRQEMSDEAMFAQVQALNRLFGGVES